MENESKMTAADVEVNVAYMMAWATELIVRDVDRRLRAIGDCFQHEKKRAFSDFTRAVKSACVNGAKITADIETVCAPGGYKGLDQWAAEANELARLVLLYADKSNSESRVENIFSFLRSCPGQGLVSEEDLKRFYLKK